MSRPSRPVMPGTCPDIGRLAAYIEGVLDDAGRQEIQTHLVTCIGCRDIVSSAARVLSANVHGRSRLWIAWTAGLAGAAAAAVLFVLYAGRHTLLPDSWTVRRDVSALVATLEHEPTRPVEARLTGGFKYAPPPQNPRGSGERTVPREVQTAASRLIDAAAQKPTPSNRAAAGVAHLTLGEFDQAVGELEAAARAQPESHILSDLSAAYISRARWFGRTEDWSNALEVADQCLRIDPRSPEASFNRALALEGLHRDRDAAEAWASYRRSGDAGPWLSEAEERERSARARMRP